MRKKGLKLGVRAQHIVRSVQDFLEQPDLFTKYIPDSVIENDSRFIQLEEDHAALGAEYDALADIHADEVRRRDELIREKEIIARQDMHRSLDTLLTGSRAFVELKSAEALAQKEWSKRAVAEAEKQQRYLQGRMAEMRERMRDLETGRALVPMFKVLEDSPSYKSVRMMYLDAHNKPAYASHALIDQLSVSEGHLLGGGIPRLIGDLENVTDTHCISFERDDKKYKFERTPYRIRDADGELVGTFIHYGDVKHGFLKRHGQDRETAAIWKLMESVFGAQGYSFG